MACTIAFASCAPDVRAPTINQAPLPTLTVPARAAVGESVVVDGNASRDLDGIVSDGYLLFGDGSEPIVGLAGEHAWVAPGQYLVELYVEDDQGATARARARITIE